MDEGKWLGAGRGLRYRVRFKCPETEHEYTVATLYGPEKAVVIATRRHLYLFSPEDDLRQSILQASVTELGPIAQGPSGVLEPQSADLVDRWEW
jgi:hypothetical protein